MDSVISCQTQVAPDAVQSCSHAVNPLSVSHKSSRCSPAHRALCFQFAHLDPHWLSSIRNQLPLMLVILTHSLPSLQLTCQLLLPLPFGLLEYYGSHLPGLLFATTYLHSGKGADRSDILFHSLHHSATHPENHPALFPCFLQTSKPTFFTHLHAL